MKYKSNLTTPLGKALADEAKAAKEDMEETTINFQQVSPTFLIEESKKGGDLIKVIGPQDDKSGQIWVFLDQGTDVRHALMSSDWESKTSPGTLSTGLGAGRVVFISKEIVLPGIEARLWTEIIAEVRMQKLQEEANSIIKKAKVFRN